VRDVDEHVDYKFNLWLGWCKSAEHHGEYNLGLLDIRMVLDYS